MSERSLKVRLEGAKGAIGGRGERSQKGEGSGSAGDERGGGGRWGCGGDEGDGGGVVGCMEGGVVEEALAGEGFWVCCMCQPNGG